MFVQTTKYRPMPDYEVPQQGNPHQLTVNQHCFPITAIRRFCDISGTVAVIRRGKSPFRAPPDAEIFCAKRVWDQRTESRFMTAIERRYQQLADKIVATLGSSLTEEDCETVTSMYVLWTLRSHYRHQPIPDQRPNGILDVAQHLTTDDQEYLEKNGINYTRSNLTIPGR